MPHTGLGLVYPLTDCPMETLSPTTIGTFSDSAVLIARNILLSRFRNAERCKKETPESIFNMFGISNFMGADKNGKVVCEILPISATQC